MFCDLNNLKMTAKQRLEKLNEEIEFKEAIERQLLNKLMARINQLAPIHFYGATRYQSIEKIDWQTNVEIEDGAIKLCLGKIGGLLLDAYYPEKIEK